MVYLVLPFSDKNFSLQYFANNSTRIATARCCASALMRDFPEARLFVQSFSDKEPHCMIMLEFWTDNQPVIWAAAEAFASLLSESLDLINVQEITLDFYEGG